MRYQVLLLDISSDLHHALIHRFHGMDVDFVMVPTYQNVVRLCTGQSFHLIVLHLSDAAFYNEFLITLRSISYTPIAALLDQYDAERACSILQCGVDLCVGIEWPIDLAADHIMAQFRRYVVYTHDKGVRGSDFQVGEIYIDPLRYVVRVKERSVRLRPREFALLKYLMEHPGMVLTTKEICNGAWGLDYTESVGRSVHELRKQIEANPSKTCYIETLYRIGYRFTGYPVENCDN